jgi:hypothetical protein
LHPPIAPALVDGKRHVPHAQAGMAALLDVAWRATEASDQKIAQPHLGPGQVVGRIHRAKDVVARHLGVEGAHQAGKAVLANTCIDLLFRQIHNLSMSEDSNTGDPKTAYEIAMERLRREDAAAGVEEREVSKEQKAEIAEIRRVYAAKAAEVEILFKSKLMSVFDPEERAKIEQVHRRDLERIKEDEERKLAKLRG